MSEDLDKAAVEAVTAAEGLTRGREPKEAELRASMRGVNVDSSGREHPRVSWRDYRQVVRGAGDDNDDVMIMLLSGLCRPNSEAWKNYMAVRVGKRQQRDDGFGDYEVSKTDNPRYMPPWEARKVAKEKRGKDKKTKVYTLAQILSDTYVREKYEMPERFVRSIATMAVTRPADAAATVKEYLELKSVGSDVKFRVEAGAYASGVAAACRDIAQMASTVPAAQLGVPSLIIGDYLHMNDTDGDVEWTVKGPLKYAVAVAHIHRMAVYAGAHRVIHVFGLETIRLGIDIIYDGEVVSSTVVGHARDGNDLRFLRDSGTLEELTPAVRLKYERLKINVLPLLESGRHHATAVRLGDRVVVVNQHVVEEMQEPSVGGFPLISRQVLVDDLWAYMNRGKAEQWTYRDPVIGELACVMYHNGVSVMLSPMFQIQVCDGATILSKLVEGVVQGMSGGAVVAVSDFAFLGVHRGQNQVKLQAMRVTRTAYDDLCDFVSDSQNTGADKDPVRVTSGIEETIVARGLFPVVLELLGSMAAVYDGAEHVGTAVCVGGELLSTSCGPKELVMENLSGTVEFNPREGSVLQGCESPTFKLPSVERTRLPQLGESVVLVGKDAEGSIVSSGLTVVSVGPYRRNFFVEFEPTKYNVEGAAVFSLSDGAMLGVVVRVSGGTGFFCVAFPNEEFGDVVRMEILGRLLPRMAVDTWEEEEVIRALDARGTPGGLAAEMLGRGCFRLAVYRSLAQRGVSVEHWDAEVDRLLEPGRLARAAARLDLVKLMMADGGDGEILSDELVAGRVFALVNVMNKYEDTGQVDAWLETTRMIDSGRFPGRVELVRRSSGFAVLSEEGRELPAYNG